MPRKRPMLLGPNGERRPTSPVAATVSAIEELVAKYEDRPEDGEPAADLGARSRDVPDVRAARSERVPAQIRESVPRLVRVRDSSLAPQLWRLQRGSGA